MKGLQKVEIKKLIGPLKDAAAIFLGNENKIFVMYIGQPEAAAIIRELQGQGFARPLTHDLIHYILLGFNIELKHVIISSIRENTFFATLVLEQKITDEKNEWAGKRNEVRIDARPSDSIILALKFRRDIYVTDDIMNSVKDMTEELKNMPTLPDIGAQDAGGPDLHWGGESGESEEGGEGPENEPPSSGGK